MLFGDTESGGEAKTGAFAFVLGGEERLKDSLHGGRIHADAGVRDAELDVAAGRDGGVSPAEVPAELDIARFDEKLAAIGHGIASVQAKINQDLLDLRGVGLGGAKIGGQQRLNLDLFADDALQERHRFADDIVEIETAGSEHLAARIGQELTR